MGEIKKIAALILFVACAINAQQSTFSQKGSRWFGGGLGFYSIGKYNESERMKILHVSPILRFFPANHFMVGPHISWTGILMDYERMDQIGIGAEIGGVFKIDGIIIPYVCTGGSLVLFGWTIPGQYAGSPDTYETALGFMWPVSGGLIIPIGKIFALQIEPSFSITIVENKQMNIFSLHFGICGIGEKSAVTVLQSMSGLISMF